MKKSQTLISTTVFIFLFTLVLSFALASTLRKSIDGKSSAIDFQALGLSYGSSSKTYTAVDYQLNNESITININNTNVDRLNRVINITVDANGMLDSNDGVMNVDDVQDVTLNITIPNNTQVAYSMTHVGANASDEVYELIWATNTSMSNGTYEIRAFPIVHYINSTVENYTKFNYNSDLSTIFVINHEPLGFVELNSTEIYRNETLEFNVLVYDAETPFENLTWQLRLIKEGASEIMSWGTGDDLNQTYQFSGVDDSLLGSYYFILEINDTSAGKFVNTLGKFNVTNHIPLLLGYDYNYSAQLKRGVDNMFFEINVSDYEDPVADLNVNVLLQKPGSLVENQSFSMTYNASTGKFTGKVSPPIGWDDIYEKYNIIVQVIDSDNGINSTLPSASNQTTIINNMPETLGILINNKSIANGSQYYQNENLVFYLNVTDKEESVKNSISFVELNLYNVETGKNYSFLTWRLKNFTVTVPALYLEPGTWHVYVNAFDIDGGFNIGADDATVGAIEILHVNKDITLLSTIAAFSLIFGIVLGSALTWRVAKSKINSIRSDLLIKKTSMTGGQKKKQKRKQKSREVKSNVSQSKKDDDKNTKNVPGSKPDTAKKQGSSGSKKTSKTGKKKGSKTRF
ncbi:MAG: hypothetical protein ACTSVI_04435 [Promethearchaeota archaeon]